MESPPKTSAASWFAGFLFIAGLLSLFLWGISSVVTARSIVEDLHYKDVAAAHLLVLSEHEHGIENSLLLVQFTTNNWRLVHSRRVGPNDHWSTVIIYDTPVIGYREYPHLPTESEVDVFIGSEGWLFESSDHLRFLKGKIYASTWEKVLGYEPKHSWVFSREIRSMRNQRMIAVLNAFADSTDAATQERLIDELVEIKKLPFDQREPALAASFYPVNSEGSPMPQWRDLQNSEIKAVLLADGSGWPPLFKERVVQVQSATVVAKLRNLESRTYP